MNVFQNHEHLDSELEDPGDLQLLLCFEFLGTRLFFLV